MRIYKLALFLCLMQSSTLFATLKVAGLQCNRQPSPQCVAEQNPVLSWKLISEKGGILQSAYQIEVLQDNKVIWNSGKVMSDKSTGVPYTGAPLLSACTYTWRVRAWDNKGQTSGWSAYQSWQTGIFSINEWKAKAISAGMNSESVETDPIPAFRKVFTYTKKLKNAVLFASAQGLYKTFVNGKPVTDAMFTPGYTSYHNRILYQAYNVTSLIGNNQNVLAAVVGKGWYSGVLSWNHYRNFYGNQNSVLLQLQLQYADGTTETIASDGSWKTATSNIRYSDIYNGECIDARVDSSWLKPNFDDTKWKNALEVTFPIDKLQPQSSPYVRKHEVLRPVSVIQTATNEYIVDFGQNFSGIVRLRTSGVAGDSVVLLHGEVLDNQGKLYTENLRKAQQRDVFVLSGKAQDVFEPSFTFHGFRYVHISNLKKPLTNSDIEAYALYSDIPPTGTFSCSDSLVNQLQHNIQWGQKSNFLDVPTDCPQRDERLGWTGDAQVFSRTAMFNADCNRFFSKWFEDIRVEQKADGSVPFYVPRLKTETEYSTAGWADVVTIIPWNMYLIYGDTLILKQQYNSMKGWVNYMKTKSVDNLWNTNWHYGDWLSYDPNNDLYGDAAITNKHYIAQCFYAHSTQLLINTARVLGKTEDVKMYSNLLETIKKAFLAEYVTPNGRLISETQTAYTLALEFEMVPEAMRPMLVKRLVENIKYYNIHLTTGFLGTPYLMHVLSRYGQNEIAYKLMLQKDYPSWLYPVTKGATTIWERWDGIKPDSTFQDVGMNSFNHYAYGAIGDWLYRVVAGINEDPAMPGYKHILLKPQPGGGLTNARASLESVYGKIVSDWEIKDGTFVYKVEIPANTTASICFPFKNEIIKVGSGKYIYQYKTSKQ